MTETNLQEVRKVDRHTGGDKCQYGCGDAAEFVVDGSTGSTRVSFVGCRSCLNQAAIYPIDDEWVGEVSDS
ncbi:hypothetical protein GCM10009066_19370 [Halarchaeum salinum]|uniref:Transcriptional regulator n=1 Tax=Halarchaeum salinum TaxID=489912 RepID=A0AAV3S9N3_9EURY